MLTKTKIALSSALIFGFASAAVAQQVVVEPFGGQRGAVEASPYDYDGPVVAVAPGVNARSGIVVRERDDFTGFAPRNQSDNYASTPGNQ